jgi:Uma2 family endonuclease
MAFEEFEQLPDTPEELELLEGELIRLPPRKRPHMEAAERLYEVLKAPVEQLRRTAPQIPIGRVHIEMGYLLSTKPRSWLRPDVSITSPEQPGEDFYEGAPWMVFEIVWDRTRRRA